MEWRTPSGDVYTGQNPPAGSEMLGILYPRAGTLGGCGSHNALITIYPHDSDWDNIASLTGDHSWSASNMRTYFEKMERCEYLSNSVVGHGFDGWLAVSEADVTLIAQDTKVFQQLVGAATSIGKGLGSIITSLTQLLNVLLADPNSVQPGRDSTTGLFQIPLTMQDATRNGPRDFVNSVANAKKADGSKMYPLDVRLNCLVTRVIFSNDSTPRATGVEFLDGKSLYRADPRATGTGNTGTPGSVSANKEVILAAGAFNTPQLLKLSGVGPSDELKSFNIPVVKDLPGVGTNLQDRYESGVTGFTSKPFTATADCTFNNGTADPCLTRWQDDTLGRGVYGTNGFAAAIITRSQVAADTNNDLFIFGGPFSFHGYYLGYADDAVRDANHWTWAILKAHTGNKAGTVKLKSSDPRDTPDINFNYFDTGTTSGGADTRDLDAVVEGIAMARKVYKSLPLFSETYTETLPGPSVTSDDEVRGYVQDNTWGHHASCTCPIGADGDKLAVLDSKFRVRGVDGLRVVDASVFPVIPGIFIAVPVYMVGEKGADTILNG